MKKIFLTGCFLFFWSILFSSVALAQSTTNELIKLPLFVAGDNKAIDKVVDRDLMMAGNQVRVSSNIEGDAYVAGGQADISGTINGNLVVAGGNVTISGQVAKNLIVAGGQVKIEEAAMIGGYVLAGGGTVNLMGQFLGPVKVAGGTLVVGEKAVINGSLEADVSKSEIATGSIITGKKKVVIHETKKLPEKQVKWQQLGFVKEIVSFLSKLVVLLLFVKLFGQKIKQTITSISLWAAIGIGLVVLIVTPILNLILMMTVVGIPLSMISGAVYLISLYLSGIVVAILIGHFVYEKGYIKTKSHYLQGCVGLLLLALVTWIPFVGGLIKFIVLILGLGIIAKSLQAHFPKN